MIQKFKNGHWPIFLFSSFTSVGNLFLPLILVRLLSTKEIGFYKIFFLHLSAIPFIIMAGGPLYSVYYWSGKTGEEKRTQLNATWTMTVVLSSLALFIGLPLRHILAHRLGLTVDYFTLMLVIGALNCPAAYYAELTIAQGQTFKGSLFSTIIEVIRVTGFIVIAINTASLYHMLQFYVFIYVLKLMIGIYLNKRENQIQFELSKTSIYQTMSYCLPIAFTGLLGFFIDKIDLLSLAGKLNATTFAYYSMGCLAIPPLYLLEMSVQKALIPAISRHFIEKNSELGTQVYRKSISDIAFLIIPSIFGLMTFAEPIVSLLYTDQYKDSAPYLQIFAISYLLLMIPHDSVPRATGQSGWILKVYCIVTAISIPTMIMATNWLNTKTVLIISIGLKFIPKFWGLHFSKKIMNWQWKEMFPFQKLTLYCLMSGALSLGSLIVEGFFPNKESWFLVCAPIFALVYLALAISYKQEWTPNSRSISDFN